MADRPLVADRSPLAGYAERFAAAERAWPSLTLAEARPNRQWLVHTDPQTPGPWGLQRPAANRAVLGEPSVIWLGPTEFLVWGDWSPGDPTPDGAGAAIAVDVSDQRTAIRIAGPSARATLASGCAIDLHPRSVRRGDAFTTLLAQCGVTVIVLDPGPGDGGFDAPLDALLLVRSSFARYLADWLLDALAP